MTSDWKSDESVESLEIAIIGMSGRFPGAEIVDVRPPKPVATEDEIENLHSEPDEQGDD